MNKFKKHDEINRPNAETLAGTAPKAETGSLPAADNLAADDNPVSANHSNTVNNTANSGSMEAVSQTAAANDPPADDSSSIADALITFKSRTDEKPASLLKPSPDKPVPGNDPLDDAISRNSITGDLLKPYLRQAMYYETDQMGIIHHSNYIRWFEESRIYFLDQIGLSYNKLEENGIMIPVLGVSCEYKSSVRFNDKVIILPKVVFFNGFKMTIQYQILDSNTHGIKTRGESQHCFVNKEFKPINVKKNFREIYDILASWVN